MRKSTARWGTPKNQGDKEKYSKKKRGTEKIKGTQRKKKRRDAQKIKGTQRKKKRRGAQKIKGTQRTKEERSKEIKECREKLRDRFIDFTQICPTRHYVKTILHDN
jgi:hypothetical protein